MTTVAAAVAPPVAISNSTAAVYNSAIAESVYTISSTSSAVYTTRVHCNGGYFCVLSVLPLPLPFRDGGRAEADMDVREVKEPPGGLAKVMIAVA